MVWFIIGLIVILVGLVASFIVDGFKWLIRGGSFTLGVVFIFLGSFYTQEVGEALVVKNADGTIAREDTTPGLELKAPWQDTVSFDIKGQQILFKGNGKPTSENEVVDRPEITVSTSDKVPSNIDIAVRYSVQPDKVSEIYTAYKTEDAFFQRLISQDVSSVVKDSASGFTVDTLIGDRAKFAKVIEDNLKARWSDKGVIVENVALQTVRPPQTILDRINKAQEAQQQLAQAQAATKVKLEEAKQKTIEAQGTADANRILANSLSEKVLQSQYIDALKNAKNLVVVPNGSSPMIQVPSK